MPPGRCCQDQQSLSGGHVQAHAGGFGSSVFETFGIVADLCVREEFKLRTLLLLLLYSSLTASFEHWLSRSDLIVVWQRHG